MQTVCASTHNKNGPGISSTHYPVDALYRTQCTARRGRKPVSRYSLLTQKGSWTGRQPSSDDLVLSSHSRKPGHLKRVAQKIFPWMTNVRLRSFYLLTTEGGREIEPLNRSTHHTAMSTHSGPGSFVERIQLQEPACYSALKALKNKLFNPTLPPREEGTRLRLRDRDLCFHRSGPGVPCSPRAYGSTHVPGTA